MAYRGSASFGTRRGSGRGGSSLTPRQAIQRITRVVSYHIVSWFLSFCSLLAGSHPPLLGVDRQAAPYLCIAAILLPANHCQWAEALRAWCASPRLSRLLSIPSVTRTLFGSPAFVRLPISPYC